jgi:hypothetical protein
MKNIFLLLILGCIKISSFGQVIKISDGTKVKSINSNSFLEAIIAERGKINGKNCCDYEVFKGTIKSANKDSLTLKLTEINVKKHIDNTLFKYELLFPRSATEKTLAIKDILYIDKYKSEKSSRRDKITRGIGGLLLFTGSVTALNNFFVKEKSNKKALLISGGIQFGAGITLLALKGPKRYYLKHNIETWHFVE